MTENEIATQVVYAANKVHVDLGPGLLESLYIGALVHEINKRGLKVEAEVVVPAFYDGIEITEGLLIDLVVENKVFVEVTSIEKTTFFHEQHLRTTLRLSGKRIGLLINFGEALIKNGITWIMNDVEIS
jgi:GxxExxY protein